MKRVLRFAVLMLDEILDRIPTIGDGRIYWMGGWGCRLRLHRWWLEQ